MLSGEHVVSVLLTLPLQCYLFHMYVGVRAGGGIGDEIEDPAGDEYELYRVVFDITFFFFVIVILLAIIQGQCWLGWGSWGSVPRGRPPPLRVQAQEPVCLDSCPGLASPFETWGESPLWGSLRFSISKMGILTI